MVGIKRGRGVGTLISFPEGRDLGRVLNDDGETDENEYMTPEEGGWYRSVAARSNYKVLDRTDVQFGTRNIDRTWVSL